MTRREALGRLKDTTFGYINALQGDKSFEEHEQMRLIDECAEVEHINQCVESAEKLICWLTIQISQELEREGDLLPEEGNPGYLAGQ